MDDKVSLWHVLDFNSLTTPIDVNVFQESSSAAGTQSVSVVIDRDRLRQVETLLWQLGQPPLVPTGVNELETLEGNVESDELGSSVRFSVGNPLQELQRHLGHHPVPHSLVPSRWNLGALDENTESHEVKASGRPSNNNPFFSLPQYELQDRCDDPSELQDLTAAFTCLSTSNNPASSTAALFRARTPPGSSAARLSPRKGTKYYAVIIGKCTGVYYSEWYADI